MIITYDADRYALTYDTETGEAITRYHASDRWSGCAPVPGDAYHADKLGITPSEHRLAHELIHHLVGHAYYSSDNGSPIIYRDAHAIAQTQPESELEEWMVTALTYHVYGLPYDRGALLDLEHGGVHVTALAEHARELIGRAREHTGVCNSHEQSKRACECTGRVNSPAPATGRPCPQLRLQGRRIEVKRVRAAQ